MQKAIWWIKRDIRLLDNKAFSQSITENEEVLPVYIYEPTILQASETSSFHTQSIQKSLLYLENKLLEKSGSLLILYMDIPESFDYLHKIFPFQCIYSHEENGSNITYQRDIKVKKWCAGNTIQWKEYYQTGVIRKLKSRKHRKEKWLNRMNEPMILPPDHFKFPSHLYSFCKEKTLESKQKIDSLYKFNPHLQKTSEKDARLTLKSFLQTRSQQYRGNISSPNTAFVTGSRLSPHLAYGTISSKVVYQQALLKMNEIENMWWRRSVQSFVSRLQWKDHFIQRLEDDSTIESQAMHPCYRDIVYNNDPHLLHLWIMGQTGYPLVDACMRCLQQTGFINFRMRAMITSFATHVLHLDWRYIQYPLAKLFIDYEPGIHISQLQMQAGVVGTNTIRVYSPKKQLLDQDPQCIFVKKWIPELKNISNDEILQYDQTSLGEYTSPIVPYLTQVEKMKTILYGIKKSESAQQLEGQVLEKFSDPKLI